ncbi:probable mitochondrial glutathione transporter SLC25A40 [Ornithodoros turicata]|uniref:probable mitochondrial glutathione transporter SLC25A40 n=1 Tax=Ornithodoros turicata TaxID=34597 RepID=UPI003138F3DF
MSGSNTNTSVGSITPAQRMICSCTGALATSFFVTPLDVVKIRLQAQQKAFIKNKCFLYCNGLMEHTCYCLNGNGNGQRTAPQNQSQASMFGSSRHWYRRPGDFEGTLDAFVKITRNEGISSLWSGLPPTLVMAVPATVIYFTIYDQFKDQLNLWLQTAPGRQPTWVPVLSGATARVFSATVISPLEMVRTKMQSKKLSYLEIGQAVRSLIQARGFSSLYTGLGPTLLRDVPFSSIYWANYEGLKQYFGQQEPTFHFSFIAGAVSGTVAAVITLPFDVIKTHKQIELGELELLSVKKPSSTYTLLRNLYRSQGLHALFTGIVPRIIKVAPACAIMISTYEIGKNFFRQKNALKRGQGRTMSSTS